VGRTVAHDACENYHKQGTRSTTAASSLEVHTLDDESGARRAYLGPMAGTPRETKVWQEAIGLAGDVIRVVRRATRRETKAFTDALMLSASAAASAIAEAPTRPTATEERDCYARAKRSLVTVETQLAIARVSGIIPSSVHAQLAARVASLTQRVSNQMNHLERHPHNGSVSPAAALPLLTDAS
jgi:four helix bundle protein